METKAKKLYEQFLSKFLNKSDEKELAEKLEILRFFLESTNFGKLRSEYEKHLLEERGVKFLLYSEREKPNYEMLVT